MMYLEKCVRKMQWPILNTFPTFTWQGEWKPRKPQQDDRDMNSELSKYHDR